MLIVVMYMLSLVTNEICALSINEIPICIMHDLIAICVKVFFFIHRQWADSFDTFRFTFTTSLF